ncbi:DUF2325 domain-containing protein [Psychrobacillus sp. FSL H8-0487]|uniref:DUF2325 domain-containing protein n=1 Tax=Psychrobacillus sp. FSL H8-0487 TaxID=2921391 RepID=UPI0030F7E640
MIVELKKEMVQIIKCIDENNVNDSLFILSKQINLVESLFEYKEIKNEHKILGTSSYLSKQVSQNKPTQTTSFPSDIEKVKINKRDNMYRFERKVRGGFIPEIEAFVPEGIVRKLGLINGDLVFAEKKEDIGPNHYQYTVAEKIGSDDSNERSQFNLCPVEKDGDLWVVTRSQETDDLIKLDNVPYRVLLNHQDIKDLDLQKGDLVDIAFLNNNPHNVKILWKHNIEEIVQQKDLESKNNITKKKKLTPKVVQPITKSLEGQRILIIGNEPHKNLYKSEIEARGGELLWADAKENSQRLRSLVKKSDQVIYLLKVSGHIGMKQVKKFCKQYNVPFENIWDVAASKIIEFGEKNMDKI